MKRYSIHIICIIFILLSIVYYHLFAIGFFPMKSTPKKNSSLNAFTNNSVSIQYNDKGRVDQAVSIKHSNHFETPASTALVNPHFTLQSNNNTVWHITAKYGKSYHAGEKIILWGDVNVHRPAQAQNVETTITTQHLTYFKKRRFAISNTLTRVTQPGNTSSGNYATINMKNSIIHIRDHAKGVFAPQNKKED